MIDMKKYLCDKYRAMIKKQEVIDLDEMMNEFEGLTLSEVCPELADYLNQAKFDQD